MSSSFYPLGMNSYNNRLPQGGYKSSKGTGVFSNPTGVTAGNIRPLTNNDPSNSVPQKFGLPRPIKHYRKGISVTSLDNSTNSRQVKSSTGGGSLIGQMIDIPGGFSIKENPSNETSNTEELDNDCKTCQGVGIISDWQPITDLTEKPQPETQTPQYCCNEEKNSLRRLRSANTKLKKNYYTSTTNYLYNRCQTFEQKQFNYLSTGNAATKPGAPLSQDNIYKANCNPNLEIEYATSLLSDAITLTPSNPLGCETVQYKPNNYKYGQQGAVSSSDRLLRLNVETIDTNRANIIKSQENLTKSKYFPNASGNENNSCCIIGSKAASSFGTTILYITYPLVTRTFRTLTHRFSFPSSFSSISDAPVPVIQNEYILVVPSYELIDSYTNKVKMTLKYQLFTNNDAELLTVGLSFANNVNYYNQNTSIIEIIQFDGMPLYGLGNQFTGLTPEILISAPDEPRIINGTSALNCFMDCPNFNSPGILNWNIANVVNLQGIFANATLFNQPVGSWDTSNVTNMSYMFYGASAFNNGQTGTQDISGNFSLATYTYSTRALYCPDAAFTTLHPGNVLIITSGTTINYTSQIQSISTDFSLNLLTAYGGNLTGGTITSIKKQVIGSAPLTWNTSNVTTMNSIFKNATYFNQRVDTWDVSKVTDMGNAFRGFQDSIVYTNILFNVFNNGQLAGSIDTSKLLNNWNTGNGTNLSYMFSLTSGFNQYISGWNTSKATTIAGMFYNAVVFNNGSAAGISSNDASLNGWDTSKITTMQSLFQQDAAFNQNVSSWNTTLVTNMGTMFYLATTFNNGDTGNNGLKPLTGWTAPLCSNFSSMFQQAPAFNQNVSNLVNTSDVSNCDLSSMFSTASVFNNGDIANTGSKPLNWITDNVTTMSSMFVNASVFNQPIDTSGNYWNTGKVTTMFQMFATTNRFNQPIGRWDVSKVLAMFQMFYGAVAFNQPIGAWNTGKVTDTTQMFRNTNAFNNGEINTIPTITPNTCYSTGALLNCPGAILSLQVSVGDALLIPNLSRTSAFVVTNVNSNILLTISPGIGTNTAGQIFNVQKVIPITSTLLSVTPSTSFYTNTTKTLTCPGATFISSLPLPIQVNDTLWVVATSVVYITTVQSITDDSNLVVTGFGTDISPGGIRNIQKPPAGTSPLNWDTSNVTNMTQMFWSAPLFNQSLSSFNTSKVTSMIEMFRSTSSFNQPLSNFDTRNVTDIGGMFNEAKMFNQPINTNGIYWNTSNITSMKSVFQSAQIFNQSLSLWNTSNVTDIGTMFYNAYLFNQPLITDGSIWDVSKVTNMNSVFQNTLSFNQNLNLWVLSSVTNLSSAFNTSIFNNGGASGTSLSTLTWNAPKCINFNNMFARETAFNQPLPFLVDTSGVTSCDLSSMFLQVSASTFNQNLNSWNVSNVTNMSSMFQLTTSFNNGGVDLSWNAPNCVNFTSMFQSASAFNRAIPNLVNTSGIIVGTQVLLTSMFSGATVFNQNINTWNVSRVINMTNMFISAPAFNNGSLTNDGANELLWNAPNCTNFTGMFQSATSFNQKVNNLVNTANVIDCSLNSMFQSATIFNNGQIGTMDISGSAPFTYTDGTRLLTSTGSKFLSQLSPTDVLIITSGLTTIYTSQIQSSTIVSDISLVLLTAYGSALTPTSIKKQIAGSAPLTWNTTNVKNMSSLFLGAYYFNQQLPWNVSNATNMSSMFATVSTGLRNIFNNGQLAGSTTQQLNWTASKCINFTSMFAYTSGFNQPIVTLVDTSGVALQTGCNLTSMFQNTTVFNQNISNWNVSKVTNMASMFSTASAFNNGSATNDGANTLTWNAPNCLFFSGMFFLASAFNQPIPTLVDTSNLVGVCPLNSMFSGATRFNQNISGWNTLNVSVMNSMFFSGVFNNGQILPPDISGTVTSASYTNATSTLYVPGAAFNSFSTNDVLIITTSSIIYTSQIQRIISDASLVLFTPYGADISSITTIKKQVAGTADLSWNTVNVTTMANMFNNAYYFNQKISNWNVSNVTSMSSTFAGASTALKTTFNNGQIAGSSGQPLLWTASRCTSFASMFLNNAAFNQPITTLVDISGTSLASMFSSTSVFNQNITNWKTDNVTNMSSMFFSGVFNNGQILPPDISGNVTSASYTNATSTLYVPGAAFNSFSTNDVLIIKTPTIIYTSNIQRIINDASLVLLTAYGANITVGAITTIKKQVAGTADLSWNTVNVTTMTNMFNNAYYFNQNISNWSTSNVQNMTSMFAGASTPLRNTFNNGQLAGSSGQPLNWTASKCTTFTAMFQNTSGFNQPVPTLVDVSGTTLTNMFNSASVFNQNISGWNTLNVTVMNSMFFSGVFNNGQILPPDISGTVTSASYTNATSTLYVPGAAFNSFSTNDVLTITTPTIIYTSQIQRIISDASLVLLTAYGVNITVGTITSIKTQVVGTADLSWNTVNVTTMANLFNNAYYFNQNISNWSTSNVQNMTSMFAGASTALKTTFNNGQIAGSSGQQLNWTASKCTFFTAMFQNTSGFNQPVPTLVDTSTLSTANCTMLNMFNSASVFNQNISTWNTLNVTVMNSMFSGAIVFNNGQSGTIDISGNLNTLPAFYTNSSKLLTCTGGNFTTLTSADVLIITTPSLVYSSQIQTTPISDVSLVLLTAYGSDILSGITSIKKQVAGTADLSWNTQNVTTTANMFQSAIYFNQRLPWNMRLNTNVTSMFAGTASTFINLFNNGQILTGTTQKLYDASLVPLPNTWNFNNNGVISTTWHTNCRLTPQNGVTINPPIY